MTSLPIRDSAANGLPALDGVDLHALALRVGTPCHIYSASTLAARIAALRTALSGLDAHVRYAVKANPNVAILQTMAAAGFGADIVSGGELERALRAGIAPGRIVFSGVGKRREEIAAALATGIERFNVESHAELDLIEQVAAGQSRVARAAARINPDVDATTHAKITTGRAGNKFGVGIDEAREWFATAATRPHVRLDGLHVHIGSQILDAAPFRAALARVAVWRTQLEAASHPITSIDVGGGLGVGYRPGHDRPLPVADYVATIRAALRGFGGRILLEPGRWLVAEAGAILSRVLRVKEDAGYRFVVLDAAMTELLRPALYEAWHAIVPVAPRTGEPQPVTVVGPVCESADTFASARPLPPLEAGDLVLIQTTGAYAAAMASTYNSRPLAAEVMLADGRYSIVRQRQSLAALLADEQPARHWETP